MLEVPASAIAELRRNAGIAPAFIADCHTKQRAFVEDKSPRKAVCGGRRGGKSNGLAAWFDDGAMRAPEKRSVYVSLTRGKAYEILGPKLQYLARKYRLGGEFRTIQGSLNWCYPNGHRLWLVGCDDQREVEKIRGEAFVRAAVDECQSMGTFLKSLVEDAIEPALVDERGDMALAGSPAIVCAGYFYEATNGSDTMVKWPTHHFTMLDNPFIPHAREVMEETKRRNKWNDDHPTYRREWLGEWVNDANQLIYPLERDRNAYDGTLPKDSTYSYCLGVDIGFTAATALSVVALRRPQQDLWVVESGIKSGLTPLDVCQWVRETRERYRKLGIGLPCVVDEGGLGVGYAEQMRNVGVACEAAEKTGKRAAQEWLRGRVIAGTLRVDYLKAAPWVAEAARLAFDENGEEADELPNHASDSVLYAARFLCPTMGHEPEPAGPAVGSPDWEEARMRKEKEDRAREVELRQRNQRGRRR